MKRVRNSLIPEVHEDLFVANGSQRLAADAAFRCALTLEKRQFYAEAVRAYEHLVRVFKNDPDIFVQTQVAKALLNRAVIVGERVSPLAEKKVQDTLITHFVSKYGAKIPVGVDLQVAGAYINRGMLLENTKPESAKADYATAYALLETYLKTNSLPQGKLDNLDDHLTRISGLLTPAPTTSELATTTLSADTNSTVEAATQINTDSHTPIEAATTDAVAEANLSSDNLTTTTSEPEVAVVEPAIEAQPEPEVAVAEVDAQPEPEVVTVEPAVAEVDAQPEPEVTSAEPAAEVEAQPEPEVVSAEPAAEVEVQTESEVTIVEPATEAKPKSEVAASEPVTEAEAHPEPEVISAEPAAEVEAQPEPEVITAEPAAEVEAQPELETTEVAIKPELTTTEVTLAIQPNGNATNPTATMLDDAQTSMLLPSEAVTEAIAPAGIAVETAIAQPLTSIPIQTTLGLAPELVASNDAQVAISLLETSPSVETQPIVSASEFIMIDIQPKDELTSRIFQALVHKRAILLTKAARPEVIAVDNALQANFADQLTPVQLADMWLFEASTYETQGDLDAALKVYDKIIGLQAA